MREFTEGYCETDGIAIFCGGFQHFPLIELTDVFSLFFCHRSLPATASNAIHRCLLRRVSKVEISCVLPSIFSASNN